MVKVAQEEHLVAHSPGVIRGDARFVTINGTTLAAIKEFAKKTEAIAILIQEHHVLEDEIEGHSKWFMGQGWASIWAPAKKTAGLKKKHGSQAGVAILVWKELGLKKPDYVGAILYTHRAVRAVLQAPPLPEILLVSVYLSVGVGVRCPNVQILGGVAKAVEREAKRPIIGGDLNSVPLQIRRLGLLGRFGRVQIGAMKPSCITATSQTEIDFFFIDEALAAGLKEVKIITKAGARPHLPVEMCLEADFSNVLMPKARQHKQIPRFLPFGPKLQEENWEQEEQVVRGALRLAQEGAPKDYLQATVKNAYGKVALKMETQLARDTGTELKFKRLRAKAPSVEMRPILEKEDKEKPGEWISAAPVIKLTLHRARALGNIAKEATSGEYTWETIEMETMDWVDDIQAGPYIKDAMPEDWEADVDQIRHMANCCMEDCRYGNGFVAARCLMAWADKCVDMLEDKQDREYRLDGKDHQAQWKQWVSDSAAKGAGAMHRWAMDPVGWKPETATRPDRTSPALPLHILERETTRLAGIWQASDQKPEDPDIAPDPGYFGSIHFAQVAAASRMFPTSTAESLDGSM